MAKFIRVSAATFAASPFCFAKLGSTERPTQFAMPRPLRWRALAGIVAVVAFIWRAATDVTLGSPARRLVDNTNLIFKHPHALGFRLVHPRTQRAASTRPNGSDATWAAITPPRVSRFGRVLKTPEAAPNIRETQKRDMKFQPGSGKGQFWMSQNGAYTFRLSGVYGLVVRENGRVPPGVVAASVNVMRPLCKIAPSPTQRIETRHMQGRGNRFLAIRTCPSVEPALLRLGGAFHPSSDDLGTNV